MKVSIVLLAMMASAAFAEIGAWKVPRWSPVLTAPDAVKKVIDGKTLRGQTPPAGCVLVAGQTKCN